MVFCAATMMRARIGRPRLSAPRIISQPCSSWNGARLRPRRFIASDALPKSAGPRMAQSTTRMRKTAAAVANLSAHSMRR